MHKRRLLIILAIIILAVGVAAAAWLAYKHTQKKPSLTPQSGITPPDKLSEADRQKIHEATFGNKIIVLIDQAAFSPNTSTVDLKTAVVWQNTATIPHQVVTDDGTTIPAAASPVLEPGMTYSFVFKKKGIYKYHDNLHPEMQGTVTVN